MREIIDIPVKSPEGKNIGRAKARVEDDGDVVIVMELTNDRGRIIAQALEEGLLGGFSFGPVTRPAVPAETTHVTDSHRSFIPLLPD